MKQNITQKTNTFNMQNRSVLIILCVLVFLVFSFTLVKKGIDNIISLRKSIVDQNITLSKLNNKLGYLSSLDKEILKDRVSTIEAVFPSSKPVMNLINSLKYLAQKNNVSFTGINLSPGVIDPSNNKKSKKNNQDTGPKLESFDLNISLAGSLKNLIAYIDELKQSAPLVSVDSLNINVNTESSSDLMQASIRITVYYQEAPEKITAIDEKIDTFSQEDEHIIAQLKEYTVSPKVEAIVPIADINSDLPESILNNDKVGKENIFFRQ